MTKDGLLWRAPHAHLKAAWAGHCGVGGPCAPRSPVGSPTLSLPSLPLLGLGRLLCPSTWCCPRGHDGCGFCHCCHRLFGWFGFFLHPMIRVDDFDSPVFKIADSLNFCVPTSVDATGGNCKTDPLARRLEPQSVTLMRELSLSLWGLTGSLGESAGPVAGRGPAPGEVFPSDGLQPPS